VAVQTEPVAVQRLGYTGLLQRPDSHSANLLSVVYGVFGKIEPEDVRPVSPSAEPLPVDCPASDYVSEFHSIAVKLATRNVWKVRRQSAHVDADDIANDAVVLLLDDPSRYALDPIADGASAAVNDAIRNEQGSELKRSLKFEPITLDIGLSAPVETIPSDYETDADALSFLVGRQLALFAALTANEVSTDTSADAFGVSKRTIERRNADIRKVLTDNALSSIVAQFAIL
jgi:hypothetical protein